MRWLILGVNLDNLWYPLLKIYVAVLPKMWLIHEPVDTQLKRILSTVYVALITLAEGFQNTQKGFPKMRFLRLQHKIPTWVCSLLSYGIQILDPRLQYQPVPEFSAWWPSYRFQIFPALTLMWTKCLSFAWSPSLPIYHAYVTDHEDQCDGSPIMLS